MTATTTLVTSLIVTPMYRAAFGLIAVARFANAQAPTASLVDVGGRKVNVQLAGTSKPNVPTGVFESRLGSPVALWKPLPLFAESPTVFSLRVVDATAEFEIDAAGGITALTLVQNGRRQRAPRSQP